MALNPANPAQAADSLHTHAMQAEQHLEKLATGLGQLGADPQAVKAADSMADVVRKIATTLAKGGTREAAPQPEAAPGPPAGRPTMDSAADDMMTALRSRRQGG